MNLISREAVVEYLMTNMGWYDIDGYKIDDADKIRTCIEDLINGIPSVPAVPLEPLCEFLAKNADCPSTALESFTPNWMGELLTTNDDCLSPVQDQCKGNCAECWESILKEWMEEQDK